MKEFKVTKNYAVYYYEASMRERVVAMVSTKDDAIKWILENGKTCLSYSIKTFYVKTREVNDNVRD